MRRIWLLLPLLLAATGCKKGLTDEESVAAAVDGEYADWFGSATHLDTTLQPDSFTAYAPQDTYNLVLGWGRDIPQENRIRSLDIVVLGDRASVTVRYRLTGTFNVLAYDTAYDTLVKPEGDSAVRYAVFSRQGGRWVLDSISHFDDGADGGTVTIDSVRVTTATQDTLITDPLALWAVGDAFTVSPSETVTVRLYVPNAASVVPFLHYPLGTSTIRTRFTDMGGYFEGTWAAPSTPGVYHTAVDVIDRDAFFVSTAPYDARVWFCTYRVQ